MTATQRAATYLTLIGIALMSAVFLLGAYRSELHICAIVTLMTSVAMWTLLYRATHQAQQ
jgi:hypothetical protein